MELIEKQVRKRNSDYHEVKCLMKQAFPREELFPIYLLRWLSRNKHYVFSAFYHKEQFVGTIYTIESKETVFVVYLAVNDRIHSKGYGSKILENLKHKHTDKPITLFIETMDSTADNYKQRVKRLAFYETNNFIHLGISAGGKVPFVDILSTDPEFSLTQCKKLLRWIPMRVFVGGEKL